MTTPLQTLIDVAGCALSQEHLDAAVREALDRHIPEYQPVVTTGAGAYDRPSWRGVGRLETIAHWPEDAVFIQPPRGGTDLRVSLSA